MSRNIKEIGKELMGKSLNSFHRKLGLTQLEKNNEMQDGILDGILSQVDDAYIEKTEQSNVMHLDGSGDGVVVLDSIEGNTMVNLIKTNMKNLEVTSIDAKNIDVVNLKPSTTYTFVAHLKDVCSTNVWLARVHFNRISDNSETYINVAPFQTYTSNTIVKYSFTTPNSNYAYKRTWVLWSSSLPSGEKMSFHNAMILEGDWTNKEVPVGLQGLQSSFEEKVNNEGKYEIEILSKNRTLSHEDYINHVNSFNINSIKIKKSGNNLMFTSMGAYYEKDFNEKRTLKLLPNTKYGLKVIANVDTPSNYIISGGLNKIKVSNNFYEFTTDDSGFVAIYPYSTGTNNLVNTPFDIIIEPRDKFPVDKLKQNKIKLLLDEPLRGLGEFKDRLCVKDGKLVIERNCNVYKLNSQDVYGYSNGDVQTVRFGVRWGTKNNNTFNFDGSHNTKAISNMLAYRTMWSVDGIVGFYCDSWSGNDDAVRQIVFRLSKDVVGNTLNSLKEWINNNEVLILYKILNPTYEEVTNKYGEPILLEGYENGTIYIDSTIVPTTTVRYTPKIESFKTLKEVNNNNIMLTNDVNDNIIPYMMDVDLMIMEKEMALMSHKNIRTIGVKDMTSMQKRTQDMLTRLIKGKTLTEQECKTRVVTYLDAGKITDAQADELMLLISEVYA